MYKIRFTQNILKGITNTEEQENIIQDEHERAHRGIEENKRKILRKFYFPKITQKIRNFIKVCDACNTCKYDRRPLKVQLQETPIPNHPFEILHLYIYQIDGESILSSVDKFSKFGRMIPIKSKQTIHIRKAFEQTITSYIIPSIVVTDNEKSFLSQNSLLS